MLKNRVTLTKGGDAGDRVISEARRIWSHYLCLVRQKGLPIEVPKMPKVI